MSFNDAEEQSQRNFPVPTISFQHDAISIAQTQFIKDNCSPKAGLKIKI